MVSKIEIIDCLSDVRLDKHTVPVREFSKMEDPRHVEIEFPEGITLPVIDVYLFSKECRVYVWANDQNHLDQIKELIYTRFNPWTRKEKYFIETQSKEYGSVKGFNCKIEY